MRRWKEWMLGAGGGGGAGTSTAIARGDGGGSAGGGSCRVIATPSGSTSQAGHCEQALDRGQSMNYLLGECVYRRAGEVEEEGIHRRSSASSQCYQHPLPRRACAARKVARAAPAQRQETQLCQSTSGPRRLQRQRRRRRQRRRSGTQTHLTVLQLNLNVFRVPPRDTLFS